MLKSGQKKNSRRNTKCKIFQRASKSLCPPPHTRAPNLYYLQKVTHTTHHLPHSLYTHIFKASYISLLSPKCFETLKLVLFCHYVRIIAHERKIEQSKEHQLITHTNTNITQHSHWHFIWQKEKSYDRKHSFYYQLYSRRFISYHYTKKKGNIRLPPVITREDLFLSPPSPSAKLIVFTLLLRQRVEAEEIWRIIAESTNYYYDWKQMREY